MEDYKTIIEHQREYFHTGATKDINFRIKQLKTLKKVIKKNEKNILEALRLDLNKSEFEAYLTEISVLYSEINEMLKNIRDLAKSKKVKTPFTHVGSDSYIYKDPYGVVLIIAPWNYPVNLSFAPLIGAIAAGNCAVIKPSELTPNTSKLINKMIQDQFDNSYITVIEGAVETSQALLQERFDYIFFTGSVAVGKVVMKEAAKYLTPVTLELGGKSPTIVHEDAKLDVAAKRIVWGKFINAGQTCIAPDYLLVHKKIKSSFIEKLIAATDELFSQEHREKEGFPMIVNDNHFERITSYMKDGDIIYGGETNKEKRYIAPTFMTNVTWDQPVMTDEIFGPILPIIEYESIEEVIHMVRKRPNPLALYLFTESKKVEETVTRNLSFGGGCINDTIYHLGTPHLPFGGVGESGIGAYHGTASFDTFSHQKSILKQTSKFDIPVRYHTTKGALQMLKRLFR